MNLLTLRRRLNVEHSNEMFHWLYNSKLKEAKEAKRTRVIVEIVGGQYSIACWQYILFTEEQREYFHDFPWLLRNFLILIHHLHTDTSYTDNRYRYSSLFHLSRLMIWKNSPVTKIRNFLIRKNNLILKFRECTNVNKIDSDAASMSSISK